MTRRPGVRLRRPDDLELALNDDLVLAHAPGPSQREEVRALLERHVRYTDSARAAAILERWDEEALRFTRIASRTESRLRRLTAREAAASVAARERPRRASVLPGLRGPSSPRVRCGPTSAIGGGGWTIRSPSARTSCSASNWSSRTTSVRRAAASSSGAPSATASGGGSGRPSGSPGPEADALAPMRRARLPQSPGAPARPRPRTDPAHGRPAGHSSRTRGRRARRRGARRSRPPRRALPRRPPRRACARRRGAPARSCATYEPSGRVAARSATRRQSQGAKQEVAPVWHAGPAGRTRSRDRVAVAILAELLDGERVPRRLALAPERAPRAAEEVRLARLARQPQRLVVHPGEHQHPARLRVLDDGCAQLRRHREGPLPGRGAPHGARSDAPGARAGSTPAAPPARRGAPRPRGRRRPPLRRR